MNNNHKTYNVYCDESCHLEFDDSEVMGLGAIWCKREFRKPLYNELKSIKINHGFKPYWELKWNAVSQSKIAYYKAVIDFFFDSRDLFFRGLIVPNKLDLTHEKFNQTHDDFYYKMYYSLLKEILDRKFKFNIYLDIKDTQGVYKLEKLEQYLDYYAPVIEHIQEVKSHEVELIQLADFFIGALVYWNRGLRTSQAKIQLIEYIKSRAGISLESTTKRKEKKFNLFFWKGRG